MGMDVHLAGLTDFFENIQMIPYTQKDTTHLPKIQKALDVPFAQMLFFDDENNNIARVSCCTQSGSLLGL